jgi:transposase
MSKPIPVREVSETEKAEIKRLARSHKEPSAIVQRAKMIALMIEDRSLSGSAACRKAGFHSSSMVTKWVHRFNQDGLAGLSDKQRPGRVPVHPKAVRSALVDLALHKPGSLGYPFELWTLERLQRAFEERQGVHLSDSTIWEWLEDEGLHWKRQESWFRDVEKQDPEFAEKRGASSPPI